MAWYRTKKSEWFTSEDITSMQPLARILYDGLWQEADREGRLKWNAATIKIRYLPKDDCDVEALAKEIETRGNLVFYEADDQRYAWLPNFTKHQVINNRERPSILPSPPGPPSKGPKSLTTKIKEDIYASKTRLSRVLDASSQVLFDEWYSDYPNRKGRRDAEKAWKAISPDEMLTHRFKAAVEAQKAEKHRKKQSGLFVPEWPLPATWLRQYRWEDEPDTTSTVKAPIVTQADIEEARREDERGSA